MLLFFTAGRNKPKPRFCALASSVGYDLQRVRAALTEDTGRHGSGSLYLKPEWHASLCGQTTVRNNAFAAANEFLLAVSEPREEPVRSNFDSSERGSEQWFNSFAKWKQEQLNGALLTYFGAAHMLQVHSLSLSLHLYVVVVLGDLVY